MTISELRNKLGLLGIDENTYSLDGELNPDSIVLFNSYQEWKVFYLDERGGKHGKRTFSSEQEACDYIYKLFKDSK